MKNCLYSIYNLTRDAWATSTNFSTIQEAEVLLRCINKSCRDLYEIRARLFGTMS